MAAPSTFAKATTPSISLPLIFHGSASAAFSSSPATTATRDVMAGWSPPNPQTNAWIALEASFGNGFLERLEHRQQYKLNGLRQFNLGHHQLTLFGIGYYGSSYVPGLDSDQRSRSRRHHRQPPTRLHPQLPWPSSPTTGS